MIHCILGVWRNFFGASLRSGSNTSKTTECFFSLIWKLFFILQKSVLDFISYFVFFPTFQKIVSCIIAIQEKARESFDICFLSFFSRFLLTIFNLILNPKLKIEAFRAQERMKKK